MKVSVSTYSYIQLINKGVLTQLDCISKAKEMGFDAIEIESIRPHDDSSPMEYAKKLRDEAALLNMPISSFTFGADFLTGSNGDVNAEISRVKGMIDIAEALGAKIVRHDATYGYPQNLRKYRGFEDALPILADACRQVTEYAAAKGIRTTVENHGFFSQDSERVEKLVNAVAHENFGLLVDMGNFLCADEDPAIAVGRVAPYAFYAHAKDFHVKSCMGPNPGQGFFKSRNGNYLRGAIIGHGDVPVRHCLTALKKAGYDSYIAIEFEGMEEPIMALSIGLENLRRYLTEIE
ncbi:sugar phosphate isomerase/epimerase [Clostridium swellfunianum]|uniref:sugar phosphate isomerase/epimerase family protein n=1 Tax=Clostridium swellfunianum TaxID=1367462 RepID=UPI00202F1BFA|nr:sugar phosphate isomerase/epimerase family protein [Clostridium swellfunianum]MCM0648094.1 sugar phosphate isomerase/epimerase [Clostridium swellfunianum]